MTKTYADNGAAVTVGGSRTEGLSLRQNFSWTFLGNVVYSATQWGMIIVMARIGSPEMVGQFALALAFVTPILSLTNLQLRAIQATDAARQFEFNVYFGLRITSAIAGTVASIAIALIMGYQIYLVGIIAAMAIAKSTDNISDVFYGLQQQHERMDSIALSKIIKGPSSLIGLGMGVWLTRQVVWGILGMAIVRAITLIAVDIPLGRQRVASRLKEDSHVRHAEILGLRPVFDLQKMFKLGSLALPMGIVTMLSALNSSIPRLILERVADAHVLGIFAAIAALMAAGDQINTALGQSVAPRLARLSASGQFRQYLRITLKLVALGAILGLGGVLAAIMFGAEILSVMYAKEYAAYSRVMVIIMGAAGFAYVAAYLGYGMTAIRRFWVQAAIAGVSSAIALVASIILIPRYHIYGAAWTVALCFAAQIPLKWYGIINTISLRRNKWRSS